MVSLNERERIKVEGQIFEGNEWTNLARIWGLAKREEEVGEGSTSWLWRALNVRLRQRNPLKVSELRGNSADCTDVYQLIGMVS